MLFWIIVVVAVCTYIVPAGQYQYIETEAGTMVDPESFQYVDQSPVNPFRLFVAIQAGFIDGAQVIFLILFGYFWVYSVLQTGAFTAMINKLLSSKAKDSKLFVPICMIVFALAGSTYGEMETVYGLIPIFVALAIALGYDALVGMCMSGMAVAVGMAKITALSEQYGITHSGTTERLVHCIKRNHLPVEAEIDNEHLIEYSLMDKKAGAENIHIVLVKDIGESFIQRLSRDEYISFVEGDYKA